ncbi:MAG: metallophosphatase family protein [Chloroflexi bacterium]|nr:metallophosphatase family protein [Chloroflexota bacterium]MCL5074388.1 metallophosphatase family protein [Chloroflexota bacterium]
MKIAIFSDIHANIYALEAVLAAITREKPAKIFCLGDLVGYAPFPNEVIGFLRQEDIPTILGNYDDGVGFERADCGCVYRDPELERLGRISLEWTKVHTTEKNKSYLRSLPKEIRLEAEGKSFLLVHGSPRKLNEYVYADRPQATLERIAQSAQADVLLFGHTHLPYQKQVGRVLFINAGSVGKPKDGDTRAGYVLLELSASGIEAEFRRVLYAVDVVAMAIKEHGLPEQFARQLKSASL